MINTPVQTWIPSTVPNSPLQLKRLERRIGVHDQAHSVLVEPFPCIRCRNMRVLRLAVPAKKRRSCVARTIRFSSWLHPHKSIDVFILKHGLVSSGSRPEACITNVASVGPPGSNTSFTRAALINDKVRGIACCLEMWNEVVEIMELIPGVIHGNRITGRGDVLVVVGDVDRQTANLCRGIYRLGPLEDLSKKCGRWFEIGRPAQPPTVRCFEVECNVFAL